MPPTPRICAAITKRRCRASRSTLLVRALGRRQFPRRGHRRLDFNQVTTNKEDFNPDGHVPRSTQTRGRDRQRAGDRQAATTSAPPTTRPTLRARTQGGANGSTSQTSRTEETVNNEISKTIQTEVKTGGNVKQLSAAVLVDGAHAIAEDGTKTYSRAHARGTGELREAGQVRRSISTRPAATSCRSSTCSSPSRRIVGAAAACLLGLEKTDLMRLAELVVLSIVATAGPAAGRPAAAGPVARRAITAPANLALAGIGADGQLALPPGAAAALAIPGPIGGDRQSPACRRRNPPARPPPSPPRSTR